jgi:hypothetical protein
MKQKEIKINGSTYPVVFTIKTMMGFERITGTSFFGRDFKGIGDKTAIVFAAIVAADENAGVTFEELIDADKVQTLNDIAEAFTVVNELADDFFDIPKVEPKPEADSSESSGDDSKN